MATKNTPARMAAREDKMRSPRNGATTKPAKGKPALKLVIAVGQAPTLGRGRKK